VPEQAIDSCALADSARWYVAETAGCIGACRLGGRDRARHSATRSGLREIAAVGIDQLPRRIQNLDSHGPGRGCWEIVAQSGTEDRCAGPGRIAVTGLVELHFARRALGAELMQGRQIVEDPEGA